MVKKNPAKSIPTDEIKEEYYAPEPQPKEPKARKLICVVKCRLRKIQFVDTEEWPENLRGKIWCDGQVKTISREAYEKLESLYPSKFELIREE